MFSKDELYHHGIIGQHWGTRNGPPYPLNQKVSNKIQKKGREDKAYQTKREKLKKGDKRVKTSGMSHEFWKRKDGVGYFDSERYGYIPSEDQSYANIAVSPSNYHEKYGKLYTKGNDFETIGENFSKMSMQSIKDFYGYSGSKDVDVIAGYVNKGRFGQPGYSNNCAKCATSFELLRRGIDVQAGGSINGCLKSAQEYWWDGARKYKEKPGSVDERISGFGKNASGTIDIRYQSGGGHAFNFVTDRKTGQRSYIDSQTGKVIGNTWKDVKNFFVGINDDAWIEVNRLDIARPNFKHMAEDDVIDFSDNYLKRTGKQRAVMSLDKAYNGIGNDRRLYSSW